MTEGTVIDKGSSRDGREEGEGKVKRKSKAPDNMGGSVDSLTRRKHGMLRQE